MNCALIINTYFEKRLATAMSMFQLAASVGTAYVSFVNNQMLKHGYHAIRMPLFYGLAFLAFHVLSLTLKPNETTNTQPRKMDFSTI